MTKRFSDELGRRFADHDSKWDQHLSERDADWEQKLADLKDVHDLRVGALERAASSIDDWRPGVEITTGDLRLEVKKLNKHYEHTTLEQPSSISGVLAPSPSAAGRPSAAEPATKPSGHHVDISHREDDHGVVTAVVHPLVKGASPDPHSTFHSAHQYYKSDDRCDGSHGPYTHWPKLDFPYFDGENPKLWLSRCADYFEFYNIEQSLWVRLASMHFADPTSRWFQLVDRKVKQSSWLEFSAMVLDRFGRDQHELLVRQLFHIKQTGFVSEYIDRFAGLMDQLAAYESSTDPLHYTTKFVDGLRDDYRAAVLLHRPSNLDTAYVLAQLQEEVAVPRKVEFRKPDFSSSSKLTPRSPLPLPPPPSKLPKPTFTIADQKKTTDKWPEGTSGKTTDEKGQALRAFRRAKGLCQFCAEKWVRGHKCADTVQLHAMQDLLSVLQTEDEQASVSIESAAPSEQSCCILSQVAVSGSSAPRTLCLYGSIQGSIVKILIDSGSSHSFISDSIAEGLQGISELNDGIAIQVANGDRLNCTQHMLQATWSVDQYCFNSDLKVLSLPTYVMIIGMDWLELFSPMKVDWKNKWLAIPYQDGTIVLHGIQSEAPVGTVVEVCTVDVLVADDRVSVSIPPAVQQLIEEFAVLFQIPTELPPSRACDHSIPLVEGASPVQMRPYRYAPALKTKIECQVKEMLKNGIIQRSSSPFSSSIILVKKKDNSWRFCVDYRHLNAITVKTKYPVPIIDELAHASGFSSLDLRAGFHQIRLKKGRSVKQPFKLILASLSFV